MIRQFKGHHFFDNHIDTESLVVDLGSFQGDFSRAIRNNYRSYVLSVEANPSLYKDLELNTVSGIKYINKAISSNNRKIKFFIGKNLEGSSIKGKHRDVDKEYVLVEGITFEHLMQEHDVKRIALLKVDIEGAEIDLFDSTSDDLLRRIDQISVEFHDFIPGLHIEEDVIRIKKRLASLGFVFIVFNKPNKDVLFINMSACSISYLNFVVVSITSKIINLIVASRYFVSKTIKRNVFP